MNSIGIYVPRRLTQYDKSDRLFARELFRVIKKSGRYQPLRLNLPRLSIASSEKAGEFCRRNNLVLILEHDSSLYSSEIFYPLRERYKKNVMLLEKCVPFINSIQAQKNGYSKITTKNILKKCGLPVLEDTIVNSVRELENSIQEGKWYVIKPPDNGAGTGVKLIKKERAEYFAYNNGEWRTVKITEVKLKSGAIGLVVKYQVDRRSPLLALKKIYLDFNYSPMLIEPYFNDDKEGFASLRCTVIGDEVVEAVKRTNKKNITSNISSGGTAEKIELSAEQKKIAVEAKNAIGADYAGVDFLVSGGETVIGEINIGPFTVYSKTTGVNVGKVMAEYLMNKCDTLAKNS